VVSIASGIAKRALQGLAEVVAQGAARDGLFERPGERPRQPALFGGAPPTIARPGSDAGSAPAASPEAQSPEAQRPKGAAPARLTDVAGFQASLRAGRVQVVNHWATWCIPCVEEFPHLKALAARLPAGVPLVGLSWDLFDPRGDEDDIREHVENFGNGHHLTWPSQVLGAAVQPEAFFEALSLDFHQVPQTWVVDGAGRVVHRVDGVLRDSDIPAVLAAVSAAGGAP
jgi:cytochrome c biogenesis protein CcmG, thiol:disulfide interchange protein DsbE